MIPRRSTKCLECSSQIRELYYSLLQGGQRKDFCAACWSQFEMQKTCTFFWQARPLRKETLLNESQLERSFELFFDLLERPKLLPSEESLLFVLALYLQRMHKIHLKKESKTKILYEANGQPFWVKKAENIQKEDLLAELSNESLVPDILDKDVLKTSN